MRRFVKPWLFALIVALVLHGIFFAWFKDRHWGVSVDQDKSAHLNVSLLPKTNTDKSDQKSDEAATVGANESNAENESNAAKPDSASIVGSKGSTETPSSTASEVRQSNTPSQQRNVSLAEIDQLQQDLDLAPDNWKQGSLLDIGSTSTQEKIDTAKAAFSPAFRKALSEAKSVQAAYAKGIVEHEDYPITEDADGTRYVNIKGVCWKLPEPGTYGEWQVVLSGCSGQKDTFRFELNITTDILRSDVFEDLPFTLPE